MAPFAAKTATFDLNGYIEAVKRGPKPALEWLFANAHTMSPDMFRLSAEGWTLLRLEHMLALRACAPSDVFAPHAEAAYTAAVRGSAELTALAPVLFGTDSETIERLPFECRKMKPALYELMNAAYRKGIRLADPRIPVSD